MLIIISSGFEISFWRERANRLVIIGADVPLSFGLEALGNLAAFCPSYIQSGTDIGFILSQEKKKVKFALSPVLSIHRRKQERTFLFQH